ncbi:MAG: TetR/AcrR family transcriptional regulator [Cyanobacteria bacterium P01_B01_bin.77]
MAKKKTYHHSDLRRALLDAALQALAEGKDIALRDVARRAGVSHTAPYRHFADKEALLAAVAEEGFVAFGEYLQAAKQPLEGKPLQALQATGVAYIRYALQHPTHYRVMFGQDLHNCHSHSALLATSTATFEILVSIIHAGQVQGKIRPDDARHLALGAWAQVHGLAMLLLDGQLSVNDSDESETIAKQMIQSSIEGLLVR